MRRTAVISECGKYRYSLTRQWDNTLNVVLFIMLNPSTADGAGDDNTIRKLEKYCRAWGYGGFMVVNLFAFRATEPKDLWKANDNGIDIIGPKNNDCIKAALSTSGKVVIAWGSSERSKARACNVLGLIRKPMCLELSKYGCPKHPLYLKGDLQPIPYPDYPPRQMRQHMASLHTKEGTMNIGIKELHSQISKNK